MDEHEKEVENFGRFKQALIDDEETVFDAEEYHEWLDEVEQQFIESESYETYEEQEYDDNY